MFVTGEARRRQDGARRAFRRRRGARRQTLAITGSQCLEQFGSAEAYMPVLEAIGRLVREDGAIGTLLRRYAPTWFAQLPWLIEEEDRDRLGRELLGGARERMLREMAEFVEALGAEIPLVLVLEDLHWSDPSTVDLLSLIAVRRGAGSAPRARHLSPRGPDPRASPVARGRADDWRRVGVAAEIALDDLGVEAVTEYLRAPLRAEPVPARRGSGSSASEPVATRSSW